MDNIIVNVTDSGKIVEITVEEQKVKSTSYTRTLEELERDIKSFDIQLETINRNRENELANINEKYDNEILENTRNKENIDFIVQEAIDKGAKMLSIKN